MSAVGAILSYIAGRLREPSTWAGISVLAALFHVSIPADAAGTASQIIDALSNIASNAGALIAAASAAYAAFAPDRSAAVAPKLDVMASQVLSTQETVAKFLARARR